LCNWLIREFQVKLAGRLKKIGKDLFSNLSLIRQFVGFVSVSYERVMQQLGCSPAILRILIEALLEEILAYKTHGLWHYNGFNFIWVV
jgi:hypothetical protein